MPRTSKILSLLLGLGLLFAGCSSRDAAPQQTAQNAEPKGQDDPLDSMRQAASAEQWEEAEKWLDDVLIRHPANAEALSLAARVSHETGDQLRATDLILEAARANGYQDSKLVQQATVALIGLGRLMDAIEMLETVVTDRPDDAFARRLLFDLLMGVDDRPRAMKHGQSLVRQRKFDVTLLTLMDNGNRRKEENNSYQRMVSLNAVDKRPLTGKARTALDQGNLEIALTTTKEILTKHPHWIPARMIQGRALAQRGEDTELRVWFEQSREEERHSPWFWIIRGDLAQNEGKSDEAVGAYLEAIRCDPELLQAWQRAGSSLKQSLLHGAKDDAQPSVLTLQVIESQIDRLTRLRQAQDDFMFNGQASATRALDVAVVLEELGRLWESEAWAAIAITLPADAAPVKAFRQRLIQKLRSDTPWSNIDTGILLAKLEQDFPAPEPPGSMQVADPKSMRDTGRYRFTAKPQFRDVAKAKGLQFHGTTTDKIDQPGLLLYASAGCGVGVIDFDLDGWPDLHCANAGGQPMQRDSGRNATFRNITGDFLNVTSPSNTGDQGFGQGVSVGDLNEDGFPDLWLANYGPNAVLINNGDGTFHDATKLWIGEVSPSWTTSSAIADFDQDGIADVWEVNYCAGLEATHKICEGKPEGPPSSVCAPIAFRAQEDRIFSGNWNGRLNDVTVQWSNPPSVPGRGLGIIAGQLDADRQLDVFVSNDMTNNHLWMSGKDDHVPFQEVGILRGLATDGRSQPQGSMGIAVGDFDHDQKSDLFVTNFAAEYNTLHTQSRSSDMSTGFWGDQTSRFDLSGFAIPLVGFGTQAIDMDNDNNLELFVSNGHIDPILQYAQPVHVFQKSSATKFSLLSGDEIGGYLAKNHVGRAVAAIDYNRDGRVDLSVTHQTEPVALLENETESENHWIRFQVVGRNVSRDAVGTRLVVHFGTEKSIVSRFSGDGYMCSNEPLLHVGLADHASTVDVTVDWVDGSEQTFKSLSVDREWLLVQGKMAFCKHAQGTD